MENGQYHIDQLTKSLKDARRELKELNDNLENEREKRLQLERQLTMVQERIRDKKLERNRANKELLERKGELENARIKMEKLGNLNHEKKTIVENLENMISAENEDFKMACCNEEKKLDELLESFKQLRRNKMNIMDREDLWENLKSEIVSAENNTIPKYRKELSDIQLKLDYMKKGNDNDENLLSMDEKKFVMYVVNENFNFLKEKEKEMLEKFNLNSKQ